MSAGKICRMMRKEGEAFNGCPCSLGTRKKKDARSDVPFYEISTNIVGRYRRTTLRVAAVSLPLKIRRK